MIVKICLCLVHSKADPALVPFPGHTEVSQGVSFEKAWPHEYLLAFGTSEDHCFLSF